MMGTAGNKIKKLIVVLGDQLSEDNPALAGLEASSDMVWMAESFEEATHVWSGKSRIVLFLSAMRHFAQVLRKKGITVHYHELDESKRGLGKLLQETLGEMKPQRVICTRPGEWRILRDLQGVCREMGTPLAMLEDDHFFDTPASFCEWAEGRKSVRMEFYYREMRKRHDILMTKTEKPEGGDWNYDKSNRKAFGKSGPGGGLPRPPDFKIDSITREVIDLVEERFRDHPGDLRTFNWPLTRAQALKALDAFIKERLPVFGDYQDAMWTGEPFLYHSLLSSSLNLKLLNPREIISRAVDAYREEAAPLNAVEGFIRQILGWREFVRGIYWWKMPAYLEMNHLEAERSLPDFYWTGDTPYNCLSEAIGQTLKHGYAHHIHRLMITGLYGLLLGVHPKALHEWYLAVYVDGVEWVELPNTLGMSQYGDGGLMASKPYIASGKYINRMSNYCAGCPADPARATGQSACPFTALYWNFLIQNEARLSNNQRLALQFRNLRRLEEGERKAIRQQAEAIISNPSGKGRFS